MVLTARHHTADDPALAEVLALIRQSFAYMDGRIDPPSSIHSLTLEGLQHMARTAEVWSLGPPLTACVVLTPRAQSLYIGKLAVAASARGAGHARQLIALAASRAAHHGLACLELETRVELTENHIAFAALGFVETSRSAHPGHLHPTSLTMRRPLP